MFKDLLQANRSYRGFDQSRTVTRDELIEFVECARLAPASANIQPLKYCLINDSEEVAKLLSLTKWGAALPDIKLPHEGKGPSAFIVICQDTSINNSATIFLKDVGIVAQTMLLAATEIGLGGCMIGNYSVADVKEYLGLEENFNPLLVVAFGKPDETIVITEAEKGGKTTYYRDENDVHYVPKRSVEEVIIK